LLWGLITIQSVSITHLSKCSLNYHLQFQSSDHQQTASSVALAALDHGPSPASEKVVRLDCAVNILPPV
jgi:hypothetical protein